MNETLDLDEWLNSIGTTTEEVTTEVAVQQETQPEEMHIHMEDEVVDVPIIQESVVHSTRDIPPSPEPETISEQDFADIMQISGYNASEPADAEEIHDGSDDETDWEEESEEEEGGVTNPSTEELANAPRNSSYLQESFDRMREAIETSDLAAGEDADWDNRIASGEITEDDYTWQVQPPLHNEAQIMANTNGDIEGPLLPENSPTLSIDDTTSRFSGAEWYNEVRSKSVIFAGLGGIGSWSSLLIGRMGLQTFMLYDDDKVEFANMSGQLFSREDVEKYKTEAMRSLLSKYTNTMSVFARRDRFTDCCTTSNVMICGFDNMAARKTFFNAWKGHVFRESPSERKNCLYLDGRLSMDTLQVFCIQGIDRINMTRYEEEFLFDDAEADETVCSMKQTSYLAAMIGSVITNLFTNWCANLTDPIVPYDLPFFTEYNAQHMIFKTEY